MAIKISGILKDGMGRPIPKCTIELLCKKTSLTVVVETEARIGLDITGAYDLQVEPGQYDVSLYIFGFPPKRVGEIKVYLDSRPGTLNDFLTMPDESDLTPELVAIFQQLRNEAQQAASDHADRAELAANSVKTLTASANTLAPGVNATAQWNPATNNLLVGIPSGLKGDKGDTGPQAQLSPLLTSMSGLTTAANQLIYSNGVNTVTTGPLTALGREIIAASSTAVARTTIGAAADSDVLKKANNLSEISEKATARNNLGLGTSATFPASTADMSKPGWHRDGATGYLTQSGGGILTIDATATRNSVTITFPITFPTALRNIQLTLCGSNPEYQRTITADLVTSSKFVAVVYRGTTAGTIEFYWSATGY